MNLPFPTIQFHSGVPRLAIATGVVTVERPASVLAYGSLPSDVERELTQAGVSIVIARTMEEALSHLSARAFRSVALDPEADRAVELVKLVKLGVPSPRDASFEVIAMHRTTPFVFLPFPGQTEYAVIVSPPFGAYLEHTVTLPVSEVLAHFDGSRLRIAERAN